MSDMCHKYKQTTKKIHPWTGTVFQLFSLIGFCLPHNSTAEVTASKIQPALGIQICGINKTRLQDKASNATQGD